MDPVAGAIAPLFTLPLDPLSNAIVLLLTLLVFSVASYRRKLLDRDGVLIANIVGISIYLLGGLESFFLIVFFFVVAEAATKIGRSKIKAKHERRTTSNILGNSTAAILALFLFSPFGFYGAVSAALADTLSSEIGLLSKKKPRLITTREEVEHGTDGGITALGLGAAVLGAGMVGLIHYAQFQNPFLSVVLVLCGFLGSIIDSLLGALFELKNMLNNAEVNFLGSASGAAIAVILKTALGP